jgi:hypothetical protein
MPRVIGFLSVAELRTQLTQLLEQRAAIDDKVAEINGWLQEFETERAECAPAPVKWWYPA